RGNKASDSFDVEVYEEPPSPPQSETLPDITVQATSPNGAVVTFNIPTHGDDENGRTRQADCTPASGSLFAVGTTDVSCRFTNVFGQVVTGTFHVIVQAFTPSTGPTLSLPGNITVEATSPDGAVVTYSASAFDGNGNSIAIACAPASGSTFAIGTTNVACSATDGSGNTASGAFSVTVVDSTSPVITRVTATPDVLSPPNHALVPVTITVEFSDEGDNAPVARVYDITANEPIIGPGSGNTNFDWRITGPLTVDLRAERSGQGDGRIYTIWVEVIDSNGNRSTATTSVTVPKGNDNLQQPVTTPPPPGRRRVSGR
ncbi:MAG TPA: HYR domain-containing protein, partial [Thermoanaerobaculia bacterium]|nr:HYR domain-containing protein [Thermoanaerobaculia bacterium]